MLSVELARTADAETNDKLVRAMDPSTDDGGSFMVGLIQLRFDWSKNTRSARVDFASRPIGLVRHILTTCIHTIYLLDNFHPATIINSRNPNPVTSFP